MPKLSIILSVCWVIAVMVVTGASASIVTVAHGDPLQFSDSTPPALSSQMARVWIFGMQDEIVTGDRVVVSPGNFSVFIDNKRIASLDEGEYEMYVQFPGPNGFDIGYSDKKFTSIYKSKPDVDVNGLGSAIRKSKFKEFIAAKPNDDTFKVYTLVVEKPFVKILNMYTTSKGNFHIDARTNLAGGNPIYAIIDEDVFARTPYQQMMSCSTRVIFNGQEGRFSLEFAQSISNQLSAGAHVVYVHYQSEGITTIPFKRYSQTVAPTPTPDIEYYYSFDGTELGYKVNTTRPYEPTPVVTRNISQETVKTILAAIHINNRTIAQRGDVFVGEKNIDIWGTLGWQDADTTNYEFRIQWCDGDGTIITVKNPKHFNVDPEIFGNKLGAWCQYQSNLEERHPPIAFMVRSNYGINLTDVTQEQIKAVATLYGVDLTGMPTLVKTPQPTLTEDQETPVPTIMTPETPPPTPTIVVPLSPWIAVVALAGLVLWRK